MNAKASNDPELFAAEIRALCAGSHNNMGPGHDEPSWAEPLVGMARGDDPVFAELKEAVGPFHWSPAEAFAISFPDLPVRAEELAVISWVLPQSEATRRDNAAQRRLPAERWARSRIFGEATNDHIRAELTAWSLNHDIPACAPVMLPGFRTVDSPAYVWASPWSERHIAYACGLGTFGLCDGLITSAGKAMRAGSIVARLDVTPVRRPYSSHREWCLYYARGTCGECIDRCPAGALSRDGHDKRRCRAYLDRMRTYVTETFGFAGYGCGLCQTGVPCEAVNPVNPTG